VGGQAFDATAYRDEGDATAGRVGCRLDGGAGRKDERAVREWMAKKKSATYVQKGGVR